MEKKLYRLVYLKQVEHRGEMYYELEKVVLNDTIDRITNAFGRMIYLLTDSTGEIIIDNRKKYEDYDKF